MRAAGVRALFHESTYRASNPKSSRKLSPIRKQCAEESAHHRLHAVYGAIGVYSTKDDPFAPRASLKRIVTFTELKPLQSTQCVDTSALCASPVVAPSVVVISGITSTAGYDYTVVDMPPIPVPASGYNACASSFVGRPAN